MEAAKAISQGSSFGAAAVSFENGVVKLRSPLRFREEFMALKLQALDKCNSLADSLAHSPFEGNRARAKKLQDAVRREQKLWTPLGARKQILGIRVKGAVVHDPSRMLDALSEVWAPSFAAVDTCAVRAADWLAPRLSEISPTSDPPPSVNSFRLFLLRAARSSPGPDGIPYAAWRNAGETAAATLRDALFWLASGRVLPLSWNDSLTFFIGKSDSAQELEEGDGIVDAESVRTIAAKNTDNKAVAGVINDSLAHEVNRITPEEQQGFIRSRNFLNNVVMLDSVARIYSSCEGLSEAILAFFDFAAAFPSVGHVWLRLVLTLSHVGSTLMIFSMRSTISIVRLLHALAKLREYFGGIGVASCKVVH